MNAFRGVIQRGPRFAAFHPLHPLLNLNFLGALVACICVFAGRKRYGSVGRQTNWEKAGDRVWWLEGHTSSQR
ncbi:MAG: hypothetical protein ACXW32_09080, partial [Limisphaerales bacterium]